jgi:hypothetical protein
MLVMKRPPRADGMSYAVLFFDGMSYAVLFFVALDAQNAPFDPSSEVERGVDRLMKPRVSLPQDVDAGAGQL